MEVNSHHYANFSPSSLLAEAQSLIEQNKLSTIEGLGIDVFQKSLEELSAKVQIISQNGFANATINDLNQIRDFKSSFDRFKSIAEPLNNPKVGKVLDTYKLIFSILDDKAGEMDKVIQKRPQNIAESGKAESFFTTIMKNYQTQTNNNNEITPVENPNQGKKEISPSKSKEILPPSSSNPAHTRYAPTVVLDPQKLNDLSASMDRIEKELKVKSNHFLARIAAIDTVMRETLALNTEIVSAKLEIVKSLLEKKSGTVDFTTIPQLFLAKLEKIVNDHMDDYTSLIKARDQVMEEGKPVLIDKKKKDELIAIEQKRVEAIVIQIIGWSLPSDTDLTKERENLKKKFEELLDSHEAMMKSKTWMTDQVLNLADSRKLPQEYKDLEKEKHDFLNGNPSTNKWSASEIGDVDYLKAQLKSYQESQDVTNKFKSLITFTSTESSFCNEKSPQGYYPIGLAVSHGQLKIVEFLMNNEADPKLLDVEGRNALHWAAKGGKVEIAEILMNKGKLNPNIRCSFDRTPLHYATYNGHLEMTKFLCERLADVNALATKDARKTPLHDAVMQNRTAVVAYLVQRPLINLELQDEVGLTPVCHAVQGGFYDIAKLLVDKGVNCKILTEKGKNLLQLAVSFNDEKMARLLLHNVDVNQQTSANSKKTALHEATLKGFDKMVQMLVEMKELDVNLKDDKGFSSLYYAIQNGELTIATHIVGHKSWKWPENESDANHKKQLLKLIPKKNVEEIAKLLKGLQ